MNPALILAIYGAGLSTGVAGWNGFTSWRDRRTRVEVKASVDHLFDPSQPDNLNPSVFIQVINHSSHQVRLIGLGNEDSDGRGWGWLMPQALPQQARTPCLIAPRDTFTTWLPRRYLEGWFHNGKGRTRLRAQLATGKIIKSKWLTPKNVLMYSAFPDELLQMMEQARARQAG